MRYIEKIKELPITWGIFIISSLVFLVARITDPENIRFLALIYHEFSQRWYTIISYAVVHIEWYHILLNMAVLIFVGSWVEKLLGQKRFFILIILCTLAGGVSLIALNTSGIGFSAAGFGILTYYHLAFPWERELPFNLPNIILPVSLLVISVLAIVFQWLPSVGHYPHIAGAVTGALLLPLFRKKHREI
ncbi:rhomboid family intramembrane serine protease [Alkaliphilus crotonatoxidans]